jgi:hypothetical protein
MIGASHCDPRTGTAVMRCHRLGRRWMIWRGEWRSTRPLSPVTLTRWHFDRWDRAYDRWSTWKALVIV